MRVSVRRALEAKRLADEREKLATQLSAQFDELVRAERLATLGRLSAGVGHELANAATPLLLNAELLCDEADRLRELLRASVGALEAEFGREALEELARVTRRLQARKSDDAADTVAGLRAAGTQLQALVEGLKRVARNPHEALPCDLNQTVLSAVAMLGHRFKSGIRLERDLNALPFVRCRAPEIAQVVLNLLGNAADAVETAPVRTVRVRTWEADGKVHLEVSDSGAGINPEVRTRLFEPFVTTKGAGRGTGLGLSICKNIVESHGGTIRVDSEVGKGARFTVALPAAA
jgi:signal transduction histidine kinase